MMISTAMNAKLNGQIQGEFSAAHGYLAMACAFDAMGLKILTKKFLEQHEEEREHGMKILHYLQEVGGTVTLSAIDEPRTEYTTAESIVTAALDSELHVTKMINDVMALAESEKDYATRSFLQWFVDEQVEEGVDGRQSDSRGVNLDELAQIMKSIGAVEALNLDGGGSSSIFANGKLLNKPVGGTEQREVMSAIAIFCN